MKGPLLPSRTGFPTHAGRKPFAEGFPPRGSSPEGKKGRMRPSVRPFPRNWSGRFRTGGKIG
ncbi:MAG: hypothetical protein BAA03_15835 [Caldibacillus debilis]|nr:MAG: hypothetical protein BAA03_15835 [Caldibacillus debilis]